MTLAEIELKKFADIELGLERDETFIDPPGECGLCGRDLMTRSLFVDGKLKESAGWSIMCPECFTENGEGLEWGKGQLYQRTEDGDWLCVAGWSDSYGEDEDENEDIPEEIIQDFVSWMQSNK